MAVVLESWCVIARRALVETKLAGGVAGWFEIAPNAMVCADRELCSVAFMVREDAEAFALTLEAAGLAGERDGAYRDVAIVGEDGAWEHACPWLRVGRYGGVHAAWMTGGDQEPLVVPMGWQPNSVVNLTDEEAAKRFRFVERQGGVEIYVDTETGERVYRGRTGPTGQLEPALELRLQAAAEGLQPLLTFGGPPRKLGWFERRRLAKWIRELEALASGDRWRAWWFLGLARRAADDATGAYEAFERAYAANPAHVDVARELEGQCLALGRGAQAVAIGERNCSLHPRDATLRANLALSCMIAGDMPRAKLEVTRALEMDPSDKVTRALAAMIDDVIAGTRTRLTRYP